jgi:hypothetical protein
VLRYKIADLRNHVLMANSLEHVIVEVHALLILLEDVGWYRKLLMQSSLLLGFYERGFPLDS